MDKIRVILFGMTGFGNNSLNVLTKESFIDLIGVFAPKKEISPFPYYKCKKLHDVVISKNIHLYEGLILKEKKTYELIKNLKPDLIIVSSFNQIIPKNIIAIPKLGIINMHPSLLPKYRGPTPTAWVLINKEKETGVTVHFIEDEKIDAGRIICQAKLKILKSDTDNLLRKKLSLLSEKALKKAMRLVLKKDRSFFKLQNECEATYYPKYKRPVLKIKNNSNIKHTQSSYGIRPEAKEFPMMCVLSFLYVCNAKCPSCPYTNSHIRADYKDMPFMGEKTFKIIADQCGEYNAWMRLSGGGEPMLHPKAVELIEYAKKAGAKIGLITNGSKFTEESIRRLVEAQVDMIEFSVDAGDSNTYAKIRKGLDWDILLRNVKRMVSLRNKLKSSTKIIANAINQIGVDIEEVERFWSPIVDNFQKRKYLTWGINDPSGSNDPLPYLPPEQFIPCPFIFERLNIDSRGKVMVCGFDIAAKTDMGDVHDKSIRKIWLGEGFEYYRKLHLLHRGHEIKLCKNCPDWKYRSWKHNYWKIVDNAEKSKEQKFEGAKIKKCQDFLE